MPSAQHPRTDHAQESPGQGREGAISNRTRHRPVPRWPELVALLASTLMTPGVGAAPPTESLPMTTSGRPLVEVLRDFQTRGTKILFSSDLVQPEMIVREEARGDSLQEVLEQILGPHGLQPQIGPQGSVLIVKRDPTPLIVTLTSPDPDDALFGASTSATRMRTARSRLTPMAPGEVLGPTRSAPRGSSSWTKWRWPSSSSTSQ
jgi:hypothetical protein